MAIKLANGVDFQSQRPANAGSPNSNSDLATKGYADSLLASGGLIDGGAPSTPMTGILVIDFGGVT